MRKNILNILCSASLALVSADAAATIYSEASIHFGGLLPSETVGGNNEVLAEISNSGSHVDLISQATLNYSAWSYASTLNRRTAFNLSSSISVPADATSSVLNAPVGATSSAVDTLNVGAGGGFNIGDPIQVLLQVQFDAIVQVNGLPAGATIGDFELRAGEGTINLPLLVDYTTGGLNPPQDFTYSNLWTLLIDTTVGGTATYNAHSIGTMNGTEFEPGVSGTNMMSFDSIIAFSHAPGYEGLVLTTDSGAPISPIPVPAAVWLFGSGLIGLIGIARRKKA